MSPASSTSWSLLGVDVVGGSSVELSASSFGVEGDLGFEADSGFEFDSVFERFGGCACACACAFVVFFEVESSSALRLLFERVDFIDIFADNIVMRFRAA